MLRLLREIPRGLSALRPWRWGALPLLLFFLAALVFTLIGALAPATDSDYDSLVYHLTIPKVYLRHGAIHHIPWLTHSNFPFGIEMLYMLGLLLRDQSLAKLFHFGCGWLAVLAVFSFARRWWGALAGRLGAAIFVAIPIVIWQATTAYNELALALYAFLTVYALALWFRARARDEGDGWLWVAAITCGLALGVKMLAGSLLIFALLALAWNLRAASGRRRAACQMLVFAVIAGVVAAPWYLKSYLWTGNPVYPFMYEIFGGSHWTAERAQEYTEAQKAFGIGAGPLAFLALPWNLTMKPRWFFDQPQVLRAFTVYVVVFGPLMLAFLPTLLASRRLGTPGRLPLWFALTYAAIWFALSQNGRYLVPVLPGLCACAGLAAARLFGRRGLTSSAAAVALLLGLPSGLLPGLLLAAPAARVAIGLQTKADYLATNSRVYPVFEAVNRATPPDARILVIGHEPRCFYLDRDYLIGNHAEVFSPQDLSTAGALLERIGEMGVTHLVLDSATLRNMDSRSGTIETRLAELRLARRMVIEEVVESLTLWEVADAGSEESG
jgi:hypothetical protein